MKLKKMGRKCGKEDMKKPNKKRRIKVQNTQLKGDFSHEERKMNAIHCAISARESSNMASGFVVMTVKIFNMNYAYQDITRIILNSEDDNTFVCHTCNKEDNTDNSTDKMPQDADYDSDISDLYMLVIQK